MQQSPKARTLPDLLHVREIQVEIHLSEWQVKKVSEIDPLPRFVHPGTFVQEQLVVSLPDDFEARSTQREAKVWNVLKPDQIARLWQLYLQRNGIYSIARSDVQSQLDFSEDQRLKVSRAKLTYNLAIKNLALKQSKMALDPKKVRDVLAKAESELYDGLMVVPTSEQQRTLEELKGKEFKFPKET